MIRISMFDLGTVPVRSPGLYAPGMEEMYYRDDRTMNESLGENKVQESNASMRIVEPMNIVPYPEPMPGKMRLDFTERYEQIGNDGLHFTLYHDDPSVDSPAVPAGTFGLKVSTDPDPEVDPADGRMMRELSREELIERRGGDWLRAPLRNEALGRTDLEPGILIYANGLGGEAFQLELPDQSLFTPFDFRHPERYIIVSDLEGGSQIQDPEAVSAALAFHDGVDYTLYLRPRRWRYVVECIGHYYWISMFEFLPIDEYFIHAWWDRAPIYPVRHDLLHTSQDQGLHHPFYGALSYDIGIDNYWTLSKQYGELTQQMIDAQEFEISYAYILAGAENAKLTISRYEPRDYEYVCGIGTYDSSTGGESRMWVMAKPGATDWASLYPRTLLGQFLGSFWIEP